MAILDEEWLETDGLGGFASGMASGPRTRRYHGVLLAAATPPTGRMMLVNGFDAFVETPAGRFALTSHRYAPDAVSPDGSSRLVSFGTDPWPHWRYQLDDGTLVDQELFVTHGAPRVVLLFRITEPLDTGKGKKPPVKGPRVRVQLELRPFLSGRDHHALHHENPAFQFDAAVDGEHLRWDPYPGVPAIHALHNGTYQAEPQWYRGFLYTEERERGLDYLEDLAAPGTIRWDLHSREAVLMLGAVPFPDGAQAARLGADLQARELNRRGSFATRLERAGDAYLVKRGGGQTVVAGYPWFGDWGRDTFIALRGLCLATGRLAEARDILVEWTGAISEGMLPNRFPDSADHAPEYNAVDASLWFVIVVREFLERAARLGFAVAAADRLRLTETVEAILEGYSRGTRHRIHLDEDGLIAAGEPGVQLTWMDAKVGHWVVTPRIGKPVEIQALWINALASARALATADSNGRGTNKGNGSAAVERWGALEAKARKSLNERFWNEEGGFLFDVVDVDHNAGAVDASFRPNQIFAAGGLPEMVLDKERARRVVDAVQSRLWTPLGLRSLHPSDMRYVGHYGGEQARRDGAYHQGTVWPWLTGAFVEAWVRTRDEALPQKNRDNAQENTLGSNQGSNQPNEQTNSQGLGSGSREDPSPILDRANHPGNRQDNRSGNPSDSRQGNRPGVNGHAERLTKALAGEQFLEPLLKHANSQGHICEIADGDPPHFARGCPFQAWSIGEALRLTLTVLSDAASPTRNRESDRETSLGDLP